MTMATALAIIALSAGLDAGARGSTDALVEAVRRGDTATVRALLRRGATDVNAANVDGTTALHWAAQRGDLDTVALLLKGGARADVHNRYGVTPLWTACERGSLGVVQALLKAGAPADAPRAESGETPLMVAARSGHTDIVRALMARGVNVNFIEPRRRQTALMWAAAEKHPAVVRALLEGGADPNALSSTSMTPLMFAMRAGDLTSTGLILDAGVDINAATRDRIRMLTFAIMNARFDIAADLIERGADVRYADAYGTPLQVLTLMRRPNWTTTGNINSLPRLLPESGTDSFALGTMLLRHGADINARYVGDRPPRHVPVGAFKIRLGGGTPFFLAALTADAPWMRFLAAHGADAGIPTYANITPLLAAAGIGYWDGDTPGTNDEAMEAVNVALELGNDPKHVVRGGEKPDLVWEGATAMHGAALRGSIPIVEWLAGKGVALDTHSKGGITPYHIASGVGGINDTLAVHIVPELAERFVALAKERGETLDMTAPKMEYKRGR